jgi:hypothetical protein
LALGDYDFGSGLIDDKNVRYHGDMAKVFAKVGQIIVDFLPKFLINWFTLKQIPK